MRFVDLPSGQRAHTPAPATSDDVITLEPPPDAATVERPISRHMAETQRPVPRVAMPEGMARRTERPTLARWIRRVWSSFRWQMNTWLHARVRAARMAARHAAAQAAPVSADAEPVYVVFANG